MRLFLLASVGAVLAACGLASVAMAADDVVVTVSGSESSTGARQHFVVKGGDPRPLSNTREQKNADVILVDPKFVDGLRRADSETKREMLDSWGHDEAYRNSKIIDPLKHRPEYEETAPKELTPVEDNRVVETEKPLSLEERHRRNIVRGEELRQNSRISAFDAATTTDGTRQAIEHNRREDIAKWDRERWDRQRQRISSFDRYQSKDGMYEGQQSPAQDPRLSPFQNNHRPVDPVRRDYAPRVDDDAARRGNPSDLVRSDLQRDKAEDGRDYVAPSRLSPFQTPPSSTVYDHTYQPGERPVKISPFGH